MKYRVVAVGLCLFAATVSSAELAPADFAFGMPIKFETNAAVYKLSAPKEVYRRAVRGDLGDVRVFNGDGEWAPYSVSTPAAQAAVRAPLVRLPIFPMRGDPLRALDAFKITIASGKSAVNVQSNTADDQRLQVQSYIVDVRTLDKPIYALELHWPTDAPEFSGRLHVESSDDLGAWRQVAGSLPIANLNFADQRLVQNRVEFSAIETKFLRLSWQGRAAPFALNEILAEPAPTRPEPMRLQAEISGQAVAEKPDEFIFDLALRAPVDRINIKLPQMNTFARITFWSRDRIDTPWRSVVTANVYDLQGDQPIRNPAIPISVDSDRYWRVQTQAAGGIGGGAPMLQVAWIPHEITFIARGNGPFQLAFGSASATSATSSLQSLISNTGAQIRVGNATVDALKELGGPDRLVARRELPWKRWLLWVTLIIAVGVLAMVAYRLSREMSGKDKPLS